MRPLRCLPLLSALLLTACHPQRPPAPPPPPPDTASGLTYRNPLVISKPGGTRVESCADPSVIRSQKSGDANWYLYCTTDPHSPGDRNAAGELNFHLISMAKSADLVNWTYIGDAFAQRPEWVKGDAGLWAPEIQFFGGKYYLYYAASDTKAGGSAIGVAVSDSPAGPWKDSGRPVVEPHAPPGSADPAARRWVFDPDVIFDKAGQGWLYYGSYSGGLSVRKLSADGLSTDPASEVQVATDNRSEGAEVLFHDGFYYLLASRAGGTPVLSLNGNRWVGPGHQTVITDFGGQDWALYHAIDQQDPYFTPGGISKRPVLLDPLDWSGGWPAVRGGRWASDGEMPAPAAQPGQRSAYRAPGPLANDEVGEELGAFSDAFAGNALSGAWSWVRGPAGGLQVAGGAVSWDTQDADLYENRNDASVLTRLAPTIDYAVQVRVRTTVPAGDCCHNYVQGGLVIYGDDDHYLKLSVVSIWNTRQIEWARETAPVPANFPRYGNTVLGAPGETTWLRIVRRGERYTAYSSVDGQQWVRGGTWTQDFGAQPPPMPGGALPGPRIGLVALGGSGFRAAFSDLRVFAVK